MPSSEKQKVLDSLRARIASVEAGGSLLADIESNAASPEEEWDACVRGESAVRERSARSSSAGRGEFVAGGVGDDRRFSDEAPAKRENKKSAYAKILRLASVREQSSSGLRARLAREGYDKDEVEEALARAQRYGIVDDARFAESLCRSRIAAGKGRSGIRSELEKHGIDPGAVPGARDGDESEEVERALAFLRRKPPTAKNKRDAAYRKLVQRGFGSSVAATAARTWVSEASQHV